MHRTNNVGRRGMAGGDEVETGRTKVGESTTQVLGGRPSERDVMSPWLCTITGGAGAATWAKLA